MPRKRRKRIATESAPDIPYPRVEWSGLIVSATLAGLPTKSLIK